MFHKQNKRKGCLALFESSRASELREEQSKRKVCGTRENRYSCTSLTTSHPRGNWDNINWPNTNNRISTNIGTKLLTARSESSRSRVWVARTLHSTTRKQKIQHKDTLSTSDATGATESHTVERIPVRMFPLRPPSITTPNNNRHGGKWKKELNSIPFTFFTSKRWEHDVIWLGGNCGVFQGFIRLNKSKLDWFLRWS